MHGATIKITNAQQAKLNNNYKNTRLQVTKIKGSDFICVCCWLILKVLIAYVTFIYRNGT